ncbi:MAG: discoidin domain-containing protein [Elusimicrobia bacterium]|nr:discoidin domain-containing protein [Elusimicrobiota bacterium]
MVKYIMLKLACNVNSIKKRLKNMKMFKLINTAFFVFIYIIFSIANVNAESKRVIENFDTSENWEKITFEGTELELSAKNGVKGNSLCLDYDMKETKGYVVASKKVSMSLPEDYKLTFYVKGISPTNRLELKLIDKDENVFWAKWENFRFSEEWKKITLRKKNISFGWGPSPGIKLTEVAKIEFGVAAGEGGKGKVYFDEFTLVPVSASESTINMKASASSSENNSNIPQNAVDGDMQTRWASEFSDPQWLEVDMEKTVKLIGVTLYWEAAYAKAYDVLISKNGSEWTNVYTTNESDGNKDDIYFKKTDARYLKIVGKERATDWGYSLFEVKPKQLDEKIKLTASSVKKPHSPFDALDGSMKTGWRTDKTDVQWLNLDFGKINEIGGLFLFWDRDYAGSYDVAASADGKEWNTVYETSGGNGGRDRIYFEETEARFIKITCKVSGTGNGYMINEIDIKGPEEAATPLKMYEVAAEEAPEGYYPMWLSKKQAYWTVVGVTEDKKEALFCEDGSIEVDKGGFSVSPFLYIDGKFITRKEAKISQSLEKDYLPIPLVKWECKDVDLYTKAFAHGKPGKSSIYLWYKVSNKTKKNISGKLFLTVRPFQVNPPWQWGGGRAPIYKIEYVNDIIKADEKRNIYSLTRPDDFGVSGFKHGDIVNYISKGNVPKEKNINDKDGYASGALEYNFKLGPDGTQEYFLIIPFYGQRSDISINIGESEAREKVNIRLKEIIDFWESRVSNVEINIPDKDIVNTLKSNIAYILINRDIWAIQPGSRSYERAWIRDGAMTSSAILRLGVTKEVREYIDWYSGYLYEDGKVPCVVDYRGADPYPEYDSQGEYIYAVLQYYIFTKDKKFLQDKLQKIIKVLEYLIYLRNQRTTSEFRNGPPEKRALYGLLPESGSHEGYCDNPMHSYWDDFWALKGWKDARTIANILDKKDLLGWINKEEAALRKSLYDSINLAMKNKNIDFIPGCAEKGDFDPTSTAIAIVVCDELEHLPQPALDNTYNRYYEDLLKRIKPGWKGAFTPYEVRTVQAFVMMDQKEKAINLLEYLMTCRRPLKWNHLAEVVFSEYRYPEFIGDMPHTWVGSGYINAIRSIFLYEKDNKLILCHGVPEKWLSGKQGVSVKKFPTYFGNINYSINKNNNILKVKIRGDAEPEKGFVFKSPLSKKIKTVKINKKNWENFSHSEVRFDKLPVDMEIYY